jgi:glutamate dehydrogenase (NAD(P)+)
MDQDQFFIELRELDDRFESCEPELEVTVRDPELGVEGYVVVWNTGISRGGPLDGCGKGGTRVTPTVSLEEVRRLSRAMALKNAAAGLPLGGAKSGLKADPDSGDIEKRYRRFVSLCKPVLFENGGVFGGFGFDIGARPTMPLWACDELGSHRSFTGKPVEMGGTDYDREGVAGLGVAVAAQKLCARRVWDINETTFSVQGIGAMGAAVVRYFSEFGGKLRAISDPRLDGTVVFKQEVPQELIESISAGDFEKTNALLAEIEVERFGLDDILTMEVDVLFPSAVQDVITEKNAPLVKARMISEGANYPCTKEARAILFERTIDVIPDFIANPGGIIAAFIELTSDLTPEENAKTRGNVIKAKEYTREKISENVEKVFDLVDSLHVEPAQAGRFIALQNMFGLE